MRKPDFSIIIIIIVIAVVITTVLFYPTSKSSVPKQSESHEIIYLRDELLIESAEMLVDINKRLILMEQDLIKIREKLEEK